MACSNQVCVQFRIQHKNVTLRRLELEKEIDLMRRAQSSEFNQTVAQNAVAPVRDAVTGDMGLMMHSGEVITPEKILKRMEIAAKCMESLQMSEKLNRQLAAENTTLKTSNEMTYNEMRRLEKILVGFEKTRRYDTFTDEMHKETVTLNEKMAKELEKAERRLRVLEEENGILKQHHHRATTTADRTMIADDEDSNTIGAYITSDGRIPSKCPCDAEGCGEKYEESVIGDENPTEAFAVHMNKMHKVMRCLFCIYFVYSNSECSARTASSLSSSRNPFTNRRVIKGRQSGSHARRARDLTKRARIHDKWYICARGRRNIMIQELQRLERRLDCVMLGPPIPRKAENQRLWMSPSTIHFPAPVLRKWIPPQWVPQRDDGGFWLAQNVICYQRGYHPPALFDEFVKLSARCFHHPDQECMANLIRLAFDFFIAVVDHKGTVIAGCVVEFRPPLDIRKDPYLYISTVCVDIEYGKRGLAHQIVHAVYTLGMIMLEQNGGAPGTWNNAIKTQHIRIGLSVRRSETEKDLHTRLINLYSQCGLTRQTTMSTVDYKSFTPYSIYEWQLDLDLANLIPMWQNVSPGALYDDNHIRILSPGCSTGVKMYHPIPDTKVDAVRANGIIYSKHQCLCCPSTEMYVLDTIQFTKTKPEGAFFCIVADASEDSAILRISIPYWFASEIARRGISK